MLRLIYFLIIISGFSFSANSQQVVERVLAIVNDDIVTQMDLNEYRSRLKSNGLVDDGLLNFYDKSALIKNDKELLNYLIDERIIDSEIKKLGINAPIERVEGEVRNIIRQRGVTREQLLAALRAEGISYSDYQDFIKIGLQRQSLLEREISARIKISDEDIASAYIQKNQNSKALVFEYQLAHILFRFNDGGENHALERAKDVKEKLDQGGNFEALAAQFSEDPRFVQGGLFGVVKIGDMVPEVEKAISGLTPGQYTAPLKMRDGYRIFKVVRRTLVPSADFEKNRQAISAQLFSQAFRNQFHSWLETKKLESYVRVNSSEKK